MMQDMMPFTTHVYTTPPPPMLLQPMQRQPMQRQLMQQQPVYSAPRYPPDRAVPGPGSIAEPIAEPIAEHQRAKLRPAAIRVSHGHGG